MRNTRSHIIPLWCLLPLCLVLGAWLLVACANPGAGPDGGPYDETPPTIKRMTPATEVWKQGKKTKIVIEFSEAIKCDNPSEKVTVSPPQKEMPEINASGKKITVALLDTLQPDQTYTIDFSDAISDATEGNPLGNFTYMFSTGTSIDTMEVAGHVLNAEDLEPIKGTLVGLYRADLPDSCFRTMVLQRVARTDGNGHFCIKGVAPGEYRILTLKDMDQDYKFSMKAEQIGWLNEKVIPSSFPDIKHDTCWRDTVAWDSIRHIPYTHYLPDDLVLLAFQEQDQPRHFLKHKYDEPENFTIFFTGPSKERPVIEGMNFKADEAFIVQANKTNDTLTYWLRDTALVNHLDTLNFCLTYDATDDSTQQRYAQTDTLSLVPRNTIAKRMKLKEEERAKFEKALEKRHKRGDYSQEEMPLTFLQQTARVPSRISPMQNVTLRFNEPILRLDTAGIHLWLGPDSMRTVAPYELTPREDNILAYELRAEWRPEQQYTLEIDSASIEGIYHHHIEHLTQRINVSKLESYGTIFLTMPDADASCVVQLLDASGKVKRQETTVAGHGGGRRADIYYVEPSTYYIRCFYDRNGDGIWTSGNYDAQQLAEEVFYFPTELTVKANFDYDQTWYINELPLTKQKPSKLVKQRESGKKQTAHQRNIERLREKGEQAKGTTDTSTPTNKLKL